MIIGTKKNKLTTHGPHETTINIGSTNMELPSILNPSAKHAYEVEVASGYIIVHANNRTQAGALVRKLGYEVLGVSMTG